MTQSKKKARNILLTPKQQERIKRNDAICQLFMVSEGSRVAIIAYIAQQYVVSESTVRNALRGANLIGRNRF